MKKLLSLFVLAGVFFFNTGIIHAQDETVSDEVLRQYIFDSLDDEGCVACEG